MSDDFEAFPDHFLSVYQSMASEVAGKLDARAGQSRSREPRRSYSSVLPTYAQQIARREFTAARGLEPAPTLKATDRALGGTDVAKVCAELAYRYLKARVTGDAAALDQVRAEFKAGTCDPAWASTVEEYVRFFGPNGTRRQIPYVRAAQVGPRTIEIKSDASMVLLADWGTGGPPAMSVLKAVASHAPDVLVHLGDVYYSGTPAEWKANFVEPIEQVIRSKAPETLVYCLSGNHDMYCGGVGFYEGLKTLNPPPSVQEASFFCLRSANEAWQFLAIDTGLHDFNPLGVDSALTFLENDELEWHCDRIREFPGQTILLSHHQLFSAFSAIAKPGEAGKRSSANPRLLADFQKMATFGRIAAWFWGHEHTLGIYESFGGLERGRCIGHGAVPVSVLDHIYEPLDDLDATPRLVPGTELAPDGQTYGHGFAVLKLNGNVCQTKYVGVTRNRSSVVHTEDIQ